MECFLQFLSFINQYLSTTILAISVLVGIILGLNQLYAVRRGQTSVAYQNIIDASYELERVYIEYPQLYLGMQRMKDDTDISKLTREGKTQLDWVTFMTLDFFDNLLYQKNSGVIKLGSEVWLTWERSMRNEFRRCPYLRELLMDTAELYTPELLRIAETSLD